MAEKNPDEIGALWSRQSRNGEYLSGKITVAGEAVDVVCFVNKHKTLDKHPDWRVLISRPVNRDEANAAGNNPNPEMQTPAAPDYPEDEINPEDIPF